MDLICRRSGISAPPELVNGVTCIGTEDSENITLRVAGVVPCCRPGFENIDTDHLNLLLFFSFSIDLRNLDAVKCVKKEEIR